MFLFLILILYLSFEVNSLDSFQPKKRSAATESQIRFAIENNYDQTGPGAKGRELAYNTYKNLDEALVGYLDDPDTKLPAYERALAMQRLVSSQNSYHQGLPSYLSVPQSNLLYHGSSIDVKELPKEYHGINLGYLKNLEVDKPKADQFRFHKVHAVKSNPVNLGHFTRDPQEDFDPNPQYSFSYGVHDKKTGDSKSAQETRDGGVVHGFYTFTDADGKQRTVQYTADDAKGFRAIVRRTPITQQ